GAHGVGPGVGYLRLDDGARSVLGRTMVGRFARAVRQRPDGADLDSYRRGAAIQPLWAGEPDQGDDYRAQGRASLSCGSIRAQVGLFPSTSVALQADFHRGLPTVVWKRSWPVSSSRLG